MTDLEISKALALAIGGKPNQVGVLKGAVRVWVANGTKNSMPVVLPFDYRDWAVIGPIAERYKCYPSWLDVHGLWASTIRPNKTEFGVTPQKAIALAVIGAKK